METANIPTTQKSRMSKSHMNTALITLFHIEGIIHCEFIPQGQTITQAYYVEILKQLREAVPRKKPEILPNDSILHHNNVGAHKAPPVKQFLRVKGKVVPVLN
jgi:hypothetical protein